MREFSQADQVLHEAAEAGAVPGVVAMAATRDGPVYQGAAGHPKAEGCLPRFPQR
ncbi:MAG TPA: hypothetical protein VF913_14095 [Xanthobacteraceae bacterium]